jgi:tryptophan-rich sensory protein
MKNKNSILNYEFFNFVPLCGISQSDDNSYNFINPPEWLEPSSRASKPK